MRNHLTQVIAIVMALMIVPFAPAHADLAAARVAGAQTLVKVAADGTRSVVDPDATGAYVISESGDYELAGSGASPVSVSGDVQVNITLNGAAIDAVASGASALALTDGARATVRVVGTCSLAGASNQAGIQVDRTSTLAIEGDDAPSSLSATGNAGVDYRNAAQASAAGSSSGAGIGGTASAPDAGVITVNGHGLNLTLSARGGGRGAAGIGSAYGGSASTITVNDAVLSSVHGGCKDAEDAGDAFSSSGAQEGGPAIGGGTKGRGAGTVVIRNCKGTDIVGGGKSAGIGGGCWGADAVVEIYDSTLEVQGGLTGSAIGAGRVDTGTAATVVISGSTVKATGGYFGAGIGVGANGSNRKIGVSSVTISNSDVTAVGGAGSAGIGAGIRSYNVNVTIENGSKVRAYAGENYLAQYTLRYNGSTDTVTADGGIGQAGAAAIGRGAWGSVKTFADYEREANPALAISADSEVLAMADGNNWAIAGFLDKGGVAATVLQTRFCRNYDLAQSDLGKQDADTEGVCYLDGVAATDLTVRSADTLAVASEIAAPDVGQAYAHAYDGAGRIGYYTFAVTLPGAGAYKVSTKSDVRTPVAAGDERIGAEDGRYLGGASWREGEGRSDLFTCETGVNSFDRVAFRDVADPDPDPEPVDPPDPDDPDDPLDPADPSDPSDPDAPTPVVDPADPPSSGWGNQSGADAGADAGSHGKASLPKTGDLPAWLPFVLAGMAVLSAAAILLAQRVTVTPVRPDGTRMPRAVPQQAKRSEDCLSMACASHRGERE